MGKKPIVSVTYENERISMKNSLPYLKCEKCQRCKQRDSFGAKFYLFDMSVHDREAIRDI